MKKYLFGIISIVLVLSLAACNKNTNEIKINDDDIIQENQVEKSNIARLEYDTDNNPYLKLSDSYYFEDYKEIEKREILPSKIYLMDDSKEVYVSKNNGNITISLPIEKCYKLEDERIEYAEYGIEKMLHSGTVRIAGIELNNIESDYPEEGYDYKEDMLFYMDQDMLKIYEVSLDDSNKTKELLLYSRFEFPWDSYEWPYLVKLENGVAKNMGVIEAETIKQIGKNKNVLTDGWNSDIEGYFSNVLMGYYVYDSEKGLLHVEKLANGEDIKDLNVNKLDKCVLARDVEFGVMSENNIYAEKGYYSTWAVGPDEETTILPAGTILKVIEIIDEYGNFIAETSDGTRYCFFNFAGRT